MANSLGTVNGLSGFSDDLELLESPSPIDGIDLFDSAGLFTSNLFDPFGGIISPANSHNINPLGDGNYNGASASNLPSFPSIFGRSMPNPFSYAPFNNSPYRDFFEVSSSASYLPSFDLNPFVQHRDPFHGSATSACPFAPPRHNRLNPNRPWYSNNILNPTPQAANTARLPQPGGNAQHMQRAPVFANIRSSTPVRSGQEPSSDDYLFALVNDDFSSPSLPPLNSGPLPPPPTRPQLTNLPQPLEFNNNMPRSNRILEADRTAASHRSRRASRSSIASSTVDLTKDERDSTLSPGVEIAMAPPARTTPVRSKRARSSVNTPSSASSAKRASTTATHSRRMAPLKTTARRAVSRDGGVDDFDASSVVGKDEDDIEVLDLSGENNVPEELRKPMVDNRIKLSKFQCVICMDDVTNLTVTHCGHLFCSECLHSALHIDSNKKSCPVCRTKVDVRAKTKSNAKTYFHLALKLMPRKRQGKLPAK